MPALMHSSITWQDSVANFIGGTTKQLELDINGRSRHLSSPPAIMCSISIAGATNSGSEKDMPMCLVVPVQVAKTLLYSISQLSVMSRATIGRWQKWMLSKVSQIWAASCRSWIVDSR